LASRDNPLASDEVTLAGAQPPSRSSQMIASSLVQLDAWKVKFRISIVEMKISAAGQSTQGKDIKVSNRMINSFGSVE